jgi:hypothetical protein
MLNEASLDQKIKKKMQEIQSIEDKLKAAKIYLQALMDIRKEVARSDQEASQPEVTTRKGSIIERARESILSAGHPLTLDDIILAIGREPTRENRASVSGSLSAYVRREEIFTRPAPSIFGLRELGHNEITEAPEPPVGFGANFSTSMDDEIPF